MATLGLLRPRVPNGDIEELQLKDDLQQAEINRLKIAVNELRGTCAEFRLAINRITLRELNTSPMALQNVEQIVPYLTATTLLTAGTISVYTKLNDVPGVVRVILGNPQIHHLIKGADMAVVQQIGDRVIMATEEATLIVLRICAQLARRWRSDNRPRPMPEITASAPALDELEVANAEFVQWIVCNYASIKAHAQAFFRAFLRQESYGVLDIAESISLATVVGHAIFLCRSSGSNAKSLVLYLPLVEAALVAQVVVDPHRHTAGTLIGGDTAE